MLLPTRSASPSRRVRILCRRVADRGSTALAAVLLLATLPRQGRRELWIGDSHAVAFVRPGSYAMLIVAPGRHLVLRTGARLMFSLGRRGFPPRVLRVARLVNRLGRRDCVRPVFVSGEIDVRNALAAHPGEGFAFVVDYVARVRELTRQLKASHAYAVVPPPPCRHEIIDPSFPTVGSDQERLDAFSALRDALGAALADAPEVTLIDLTEILAGPDGMMRPELTDDGCHVNAPARRLIREVLTTRHWLRPAR